jgi:hypothetical protein
MNYGIPFYRIVAYAYDADMHCVACTVNAHGVGDNFGPDAKDVNGVDYDAEDSEGNGVRPVFAGEDDGGDTVASCGTCRKTICLACGDVAQSRIRGAVRLRCWNCHTSYRVVS